MADVFVSYARKDREAVTAVVEALRAAGKDIWVDLDEIVPSALWMEEIKTAIAAADSVVFFLTPDSARSEVCRIELEHALNLSKRIVPVVIRDVETATVPPPLSAVNWLFVRTETFEADVSQLIEALNTDIARVHLHTRLLVRANEWTARNEHPGLLLRGVQLDEAEHWLAGQTDRKPTTTADQGRFIAASRRAATRRQRSAITAAIAITAIMALVTTLAVVNWLNATTQRKEATAQRNAAISREFAGYARDALAADPQLALILALHGYDSSPTPTAQIAVREAVRQSSVRAILAADLTPRSPRVAGDLMAEGALTAGALSGSRGFDRSGNHVLTFDEHHLVVWKWTQPGERPDIVTLPVGETLGNIWSAEFGRTGRIVFTVDKNRTTTIFDWDVAGGSPMRRLMSVDMSADSGGGLVALSPGGGWALAPNRPRDGLFTIAALEDPGSPPRVFDVGPLATSHSRFSPDSSMFAIQRHRDITVYRTSDLHPITSYPIGADGIGQMVFRPDNRVLAIARGSQIDLVDLTAPGGATLTRTLHMTPPPGLPSTRSEIEMLAWSPNGYALAVGTDESSVRVFTGDTAEPGYLNGHTDASGGLSFSDDGHYLLSAGRHVEVWDWAAALTLSYRANGQPSAPIFTPDGKTVAVGDTDGNVIVHATRAPASRKLAGGIPLAFTTDGTMLAVEEAAAVSVWDFATSAERASLPLDNPNYEASETYPFLLAQFNEAGDALAVLRRWPHPGQAWYWPWRSGRQPTELADFGGDQGVQTIVGWTPEGQIDLIAESSLYRWDGSRPPTKLTGTDANLWDITHSAFLTPTEILLSHEQTTQRWDTETGVVTRVLPDHKSDEFALSGDRETMAIAGHDGFVNMWDFTAQAPIRVGRYAGSPHIALNANGSQLAVTDDRGTHLVPTSFARRFSDVLALARDLVVRQLTNEEQARYLGR